MIEAGVDRSTRPVVLRRNGQLWPLRVMKLIPLATYNHQPAATHVTREMRFEATHLRFR